MKTTSQKQDELVEKFGKRFFNELGERCVMAQRLQGMKPRGFTNEALKLANEITEELYTEWIKTRWKCDGCGKKRSGPKNDVHDENHVKQEGVFECDVCMKKRLKPQDALRVVS